jgi:hypothetical protein
MSGPLRRLRKGRMRVGIGSILAMMRIAHGPMKTHAMRLACSRV